LGKIEQGKTGGERLHYHLLGGYAGVVKQLAVSQGIIRIERRGEPNEKQGRKSDSHRRTEVTSKESRPTKRRMPTTIPGN